MFNQGSDQKQVKWLFPTGSAILETPLLIGKYLYVKSQDGGIFALDRENGKQIWHLEDGEQFLMLGKKKAYVLLNNSEIQVISNETGKKYYRIDVADYDVFVTNRTSDILFLVKSGMDILALKEIGIER